jgi:hypothetical protein
MNVAIRLTLTGIAGFVPERVLAANVAGDGSSNVVYFIKTSREKCDTTGAIRQTLQRLSS